MSSIAGSRRETLFAAIPAFYRIGTVSAVGLKLAQILSIPRRKNLACDLLPPAAEELGMAKQRKILPARRPRDEGSLLLRSAESLGRMIGTLQRQLDDASRKLSPRPFVPPLTISTNGERRPKAKAAQGKKSPSKSGATKIRSTADRKSKRASKSAAAKQSAGRTRSAASRKNRKATRHT